MTADTTIEAVTFYEVGGCVRDRMLGTVSADIDYSVEAPDFDYMHAFLTNAGFEIFVNTPEHFTLRARFPRNMSAEIADALPSNDLRGTVTADFVLCRVDGTYTDGRRPDSVSAGTIYDDLARRDFTVNAMARCADNSILDPHDGMADLATSTLRAVGEPEQRLHEDALRALRAVRFAVTKNMTLDPALRAALTSPGMADKLRAIPHDRRRKELHKALHFDTRGTLRMLSTLGEDFVDAALGDELWLKPTNEK